MYLFSESGSSQEKSPDITSRSWLNLGILRSVKTGLCPAFEWARIPGDIRCLNISSNFHENQKNSPDVVPLLRTYRAPEDISKCTEKWNIQKCF